MSGERWKLALSVALRFLRGRRSRLIDGTARSALLATTIGVAAMVIAMALMSGYRHDLQQKLISGNAAVMAYPLTTDGLRLSEDRVAALNRVTGVEKFRRVAYGQGSLTSSRAPGGLDIGLRGVDPEGALDTPGPVTLTESAGLVGASRGADLPGVVLGEELRRRLDPADGEALRLMVLGLRHGRPRFKFQNVRVVGTFRSGLADFDRTLVVLDRELLGSLTGAGAGGAVYEFVVPDPRQTAAVAERLRDVLGADFLVRNWQELNSELFGALRLQQVALFFVLGLIVLVSTFNVASSLVVLVRERMRELGVLAALGLDPPSLRAIFLLFGGLISLAGIASGVATGCGVAWILTRYELIRFSPEVAAIYFLSSVPFRIVLRDLLAVVAFTGGVTLLACWFPAQRAASVRPARALRYE